MAACCSSLVPFPLLLLALLSCFLFDADVKWIFFLKPNEIDVPESTRKRFLFR